MWCLLYNLRKMWMLFCMEWDVIAYRSKLASAKNGTRGIRGMRGACNRRDLPKVRRCAKEQCTRDFSRGSLLRYNTTGNSNYGFNRRKHCVPVPLIIQLFINANTADVDCYYRSKMFNQCKLHILHDNEITIF